MRENNILHKVSMKNIKHETKLTIALLMALSVSACNQDQTSEVATSDSQTKIQAEDITNSEASIEKAALKMDEKGYMKHVKVLSSDEFEGRAPATPGGAKTVAYIEKNFRTLDLEPAFTNEDGSASFRQPVTLKELNVTNAPALVLTHSDGSVDALDYKKDSIVFTSRTSETVSLDDSQLVFVGYGVVAPEYGWNDYEGLDMTGKTAVILVNDPGYRKPSGSLFKGLAMTYYGRWTYKFEEAARQGASGAIVIHETGAAGYPWQVVSGSWSGPQYKLAGSNAKSVAVEGWIKQSAAEALFAKNQMNYAEMVRAATEPGFKPIEMTSTANATLELSSRTSDSYNVGAVLKGRSRPDEAFIYTAHWDHLGVKPDTFGDDKIFNGAQDNATGTAALMEMAEAFKALPQAPERSVIFLAVTAEESGLLGSKKYAETPAFPMNKTVAGINIDAMSTMGASDDIVVVGYGNSQMDDFLRKYASAQNREVVKEPTPEKGFFYRSDHFNLAKKGVPMLYAKAGNKIRNQPEGYGEAQTAKYVAQRYHKAGDEIHAEWDNGGIMQDLNANFRIGVEISDSDVWPAWTKGNEFEAIRQKSLTN